MRVEARFARSKYQQVSELGSKYNLSFSSHFALGNKIIALDGVKKILLVLEINKGYEHTYVIDLNKVRTVTIKMNYGSIRPGELKNKGMNEFLKTIELQFEYRNENERSSLSFYDCETDDLNDLKKSERNARSWQMILSKMIGSNGEK